MPTSQRHSAEPELKMPVRVLLADDRQLVADGLRAMLAPYDREVCVVGDTPPTEEIGAKAHQLGADIVLLNIDGQPCERLEVAAKLTRRESSLRVVIFTVEQSERYLFDGLRLGVSGYLLLSCGGAELACQLRRVKRGEVVIDPTVATKVALRAVRFKDGGGWPGCDVGLSRRESDVLSHLVDGQSNREIADSLVVGQETVKTHLRSIYRKLGVTDRTQAVASALRQRMFN